MSKSLAVVGSLFVLVGISLFFIAVGFADTAASGLLSAQAYGVATVTLLFLLGPVLVVLGCVAYLLSALIDDWEQARRSLVADELSAASRQAALRISGR